MDEIYARMPEWVIGVEHPLWYDWVAYYLDETTWQRYSRNGYPISDDEMCKYGEVFKVKIIKVWESDWDIKFEVLSRRPDTDEWGGNN